MKNLMLFISLFAGAVTLFCQQTDLSKPTGPYLGQKEPGLTPEIFAPGIVSKEGAQSKLIISPDGSEIIFKTMIITPGQGSSPASRTLYFESITQKNGKWNSPAILPFSRNFVNDEPTLSGDGKRLYFVSNRPEKGSTEVQKMPDIWVVNRTSDSWSVPINLGDPVNTEGLEAQPFFSSDNRLYFGRTDGIYCSEYSDGIFSVPVKLTDSIFQGRVRGICMSPDNEVCILHSDKPGGHGSWDLYCSCKDAHGNWTALINMGDSINTEQSEANATFSPDGKYLFFSRGDDIFWVCFTCITPSTGQTYSGPYLGQIPPGITPLKFAPNFISTSAHEFSCSFTPDGKEFYFTRREASSGKNFVMVTALGESGWSTPQKATFTGVNQSFEPMVTSDGNRIYFMMSDPGFYNGAWSVFYVNRINNTWGSPQDAGTLFNPMKTMFVSIDLNGTLYTTDISRGPGTERLMTANLENGVYTRFSLMPDPVNLNAKDMYPCISGDGKILVFNSSRAGSNSKSGLFVSHLIDEGIWGDPVELDLGMQAGLPFLTSDGKYLFFSAGPNLASDIYWVSTEILGSGSSSGSPISFGSKLKLSPLFPNPCSDVTQIPITLYESGEVEIKLYSTTGNLISIVHSKPMDPGQFCIPVNLARYAIGTYFFKVNFNGEPVGDDVLIINR